MNNLPHTSSKQLKKQLLITAELGYYIVDRTIEEFIGFKEVYIPLNVERDYYIINQEEYNELKTKEL